MKKSAKKQEAFFVADIGGTNCRFGIYDKDFKELGKESFPTPSIKSVPDAVNDFLARMSSAHYSIGKAVFSVAGPVSDSRFSELTNIRLSVNADNMEKSTPLKSVKVLND